MATSNLKMRPAESDMIDAVNTIQRAVGSLYPEISKRQPMRPAEIELVNSVNILRDKFDLFIGELTIHGASKQDSTTGKNLLDVSHYLLRTGYTVPNVTVDGGKVSWTGATTGGRFIAFNAAVSPSTAYTVSTGACSNVKDIYLHGKSEEPTEALAVNGNIGRIPKNGSYTFTTDADTSWIQIDLDVTTGNGSVDFIQLELGSIATAYEPYTGGKPSPSPDFPQPITSIESLSIKVIENDSTIPIDLQGNELRSLPDGTKDVLKLTHIDNGTTDGYGLYHAELVQRIDTVLIDGTYSWRAGIGGGAGTYYTRFDNVERATDYTGKMLCDKLEVTAKFQDASRLDAICGFSGTGYDNQNWIYASAVGVSSDTDMKQFFTDNPTTLQYILAAPVTHDLGTVELPIIHDVANIDVLANDGIVVDYDYEYAVGRKVIDE